MSKNLAEDSYQDLANFYLIKGDSTDIAHNVKTLNQYRSKISAGQILIDYGNSDNHENYLKAGKISNENNTNYSCKVKRYSDINHIWEVVKEETGNTTLNYRFPLNPHQKIYQFQVEISDGKNSGYRQLDLQIDTVLKSAKERLSYFNLPKKNNIIQGIQTKQYIKNLIVQADECYRQLTRESLERAKQLYFQALNLLGQRPKALEANQWQTILLKDTLPPRAGFHFVFFVINKIDMLDDRSRSECG